MKRIVAFILALGMLLPCGTAALASGAEDVRASLILSSCSACLLSEAKGTVTVSYEVTSSKRSSSIGVESIAFYTSDGVRVKSVAGSTGNGLIQTNSSVHYGDYNCSLSSGKSYYVEITVFAEADGIYDSRTITTSTVTVC